MEHFFNTAGPIDMKMNYFIDPLRRVDLNEILTLIHQQKYFGLHAPGQTGKTTLLKTLMAYLNKEGHYKCLYVNIVMVQAARGNVKKAVRIVLQYLANESYIYLKDAFLKDNWKKIFDQTSEFTALQKALKLWAKQSEKPIVLFLDEVDALVGDTLISLLRQLRGGYDKRPGLFPQSIILCGVRDVRDYRMHSVMEQDIITGGSAFNIKSKSLTLGNFTPDETRALY
jgi:predicted AAA+ superfamily ATPase